MKKKLILIIIQFILSQNLLEASEYNFNYLLCDSLKDANNNFGIENKKNKLIVHRLDNRNIKKSFVNKIENNKIYLNNKNYFKKNIYLNLNTKEFFDLINNEFLGGCFLVKNEKILHCKLQSYYNVFNKKLPLVCD